MIEQRNWIINASWMNTFEYTLILLLHKLCTMGSTYTHRVYWVHESILYVVYWQPSQNRFPANFNPLELQTVLNKIGAFHPSDMCGVLHVLLQHARERQKGIEMQRMMVQKLMLNITQMGPVISITAIFDERIMEIFFPIKSPIFRPSENEKWIFRQCAASK